MNLGLYTVRSFITLAAQQGCDWPWTDTDVAQLARLGFNI